MNGERNIALIHEMGISPERRRMSASLGSDTVKELCTVPDLISQGTKNDIVCRVHHVSLSFSISLLPPLHRRQCAVKLTRMPNLGPKPLQKRLRTDGRQSQDVGAAGPKKGRRELRSRSQRSLALSLPLSLLQGNLTHSQLHIANMN